MDLDLRLVRYAVAVADELHFGKAAARLGITEQTISAQIKHLEEKLGVRLFVRDRRHVELTAAGRALVERGRRLLADAREMLSAIALPVAPLRIDVLSEDLATPVLITERALGPINGAAAEIWEGGSFVAVLNRLLAGDADIAFATIPAGRSLPGSVAHILVRLQPISLLLPKVHPLASRAEIPMDELRNVEVVVQTQDEPSDWQAWQESLAADFGWRIGGRVHAQGPLAVALTVLRTGHPTLTRLPSPPHDQLVLRPLVDPVPLLPWSMLWRPEHAHGRMNEVLERVEAFVSQQNWLAPPERAWWTWS